MRLPRMTTRRWMMTVAVVALLTGMGIELQPGVAIELRRRRVRFHAMAAH